MKKQTIIQELEYLQDWVKYKKRPGYWKTMIALREAIRIVKSANNEEKGNNEKEKRKDYD